MAHASAAPRPFPKPADRVGADSIGRPGRAVHAIEGPAPGRRRRRRPLSAEQRGAVSQADRLRLGLVPAARRAVGLGNPPGPVGRRPQGGMDHSAPRRRRGGAGRLGERRAVHPRRLRRRAPRTRPPRLHSRILREIADVAERSRRFKKNDELKAMFKELADGWRAEIAARAEPATASPQPAGPPPVRPDRPAQLPPLPYDTWPATAGAFIGRERCSGSPTTPSRG